MKTPSPSPDELFDVTPIGYTPLADRMRPSSLDEMVGQDHLLGPGKPLRRAIETQSLPSLILWGPPGCGKTTVAHVIASAIQANVQFISAIMSGVKEIKSIIDDASRRRREMGQKTVLFVDEIHRFNKAQQDAFLPFVENGTIILIGATTENPSFEVISPLLSRAKVYTLEPLSDDHIITLLNRAITAPDGLGSLPIDVTEEAKRVMAKLADGDARRALNILETSADLASVGPEGRRSITPETVTEVVQHKGARYDKGGEDHYTIISAFIKSMRGSSPDAALYYLARMLEGGEDPLFVVRRMVIFASEDIGNADPQAIQVAIATMQAVHFVGMPEGWIPMAHCATYLATAPKSNAAYAGYKAALADLKATGSLPVPLHLRNAPTRLMKQLGYGKEYHYPHEHADHFVKADYLPDDITDHRYYEPSDNGYEKHIKQRLKQWWNR